MTGSSTGRALFAALAVSVALVVQLSVFAPLAWRGVVPNLVLLVVVAAALARGPQFGMLLGFAGGVMLDLVPPADHVAGRWALALLVVGYVVGRVTDDTAIGRQRQFNLGLLVALVAGASFLGSSVFAVSGALLADPPLATADLLLVLLVGVAWDVVLTPVVVPLVMRAFERLEPEPAT
jgi:rod shape-determining protein MreD